MQHSTVSPRIVGDLSSTFVITVDRSTCLAEIATHLAGSDVGIVVVVDSGSIAGIVSERDLVLAVAEAADLSEVRAEDVMATDLVAVDSSDDIEMASEHMLNEGVRHLIVTGSDRGVVSIRDLLAAWVDREGSRP